MKRIRDPNARPEPMAATERPMINNSGMYRYRPRMMSRVPSKEMVFARQRESGNDEGIQKIERPEETRGNPNLCTREKIPNEILENFFI